MRLLTLTLAAASITRVLGYGFSTLSVSSAKPLEPPSGVCQLRMDHSRDPIVDRVYCERIAILLPSFGMSAAKRSIRRTPARP